MTGWLDSSEPVDEASLTFGEQTLGNPGAVGGVHRIDDETCYKRYFEPRDAAHLDSLIAWRTSLTQLDQQALDSHCAWPVRRVQRDGRTTGFLMAAAPADFWADMVGEVHTVELQHLIHARTAARLGIPPPSLSQRLGLVRDLARVLELFDRHDLVYGDVNERNVLWTVRNRPRVYLLDCDNARLQGAAEPANVAVARSDMWRDPVLADGASPDVDSDRYALAVFFYRVFYGVTERFDVDEGTILIPDNYPALPGLEDLLTSGLGRNRPRPDGRQWAIELARTRLRPAQPSNVPDPVPVVPTFRWTKTRTAVACVVTVLALIVVGQVVLGDDNGPTPHPSVALTGSLDTWAAGPIKINIQKVYLSVKKKGNDTWGYVYLRVGLTNTSPDVLVLQDANQALFLVVEPGPEPSSTPAVGATTLAAPGSQHVVGYGFSSGWTVGYASATFTPRWQPSANLSPGASYHPDTYDTGTIIYQIPAPSGTESPSPQGLHVLGIGWLRDSESPAGFTPVSSWPADTGSFATFLNP